MSILGTGLYPLQLAARLVGAEPRTVRRWMLGYDRKYRGDRVHTSPLWRTQHVDAGLPGESIGFRDLLELRLVSAFAKHGVSLHVIKATADAARTDLGTDYPLTSKKFLTDGKRIFVEAMAQSGEPHMMDVLRKQFVFSDIIRPSLYAGIDYEDGDARRWFPLEKNRKSLVLDPEIQFGTPILANYGVPTDTVYCAYLAEDKDFDRVARIFDIPARDVATAVQFEQSLVA